MTDAEVYTMFTRLEREENARMEGANYPRILGKVSEATGRTVDEVREIAIRLTFADPN